VATHSHRRRRRLAGLTVGYRLADREGMRHGLGVDKNRSEVRRQGLALESDFKLANSGCECAY
jgi:hypothetical protein